MATVPKESSSNRINISATPVIFIAHLLCIAVVVLTLFWIFHLRHGISFSSNSSERLFDAHVVFMLIGLVICGEAVMAFRIIPAGRRKVRKMVHMLINLVGLLFGGLGIHAVLEYFKEEGMHHMQRLHSWIGVGVIFLFVLQFLIGFTFFIFPGASTSKRAKFLPWHVFLGLVVFFLSICSAMTGLVERFMILKLHGKEAILVNITGMSIILYAVAVVLIVILP